MSASNIDKLLELWTTSLSAHSDCIPPFSDHSDMYDTIDNTPLGEPFLRRSNMLPDGYSWTQGDVPWRDFTISFRGEKPPGEPPSWMVENFVVHYRDPREIVKNMIANPDFKNEIDFASYREYDERGRRRLRDFMSGDWSWRQAVSFPSSSRTPSLPAPLPYTPPFLTYCGNRKPWFQNWGTRHPRDSHSCRSSLAATKPQYRWQPAKPSTIRSICPLVM